MWINWVTTRSDMTTSTISWCPDICLIWVRTILLHGVRVGLSDPVVSPAYMDIRLSSWTFWIRKIWLFMISRVGVKRGNFFFVARFCWWTTGCARTHVFETSCHCIGNTKKWKSTNLKLILEQEFKSPSWFPGNFYQRGRIMTELIWKLKPRSYDMKIWHGILNLDF